MPWTSDQVLALAPDASSAAAGKGLAFARKWLSLGCHEVSLWGECQGSGKSPYQACIDLSEPAGVQMVALLALNDEGAPCYDHENAAALASLGVPAFACTPDLFPDLMAAAISKQDLHDWAASRDLNATRLGS